MFDRYYDEMEVGDHRVFRGVTISEAHLLGFAGVTGDHYVLHTDAEYAATTPFGQRVAHGLLVLSCGAGLVPLEPGRVAAFLGMDQVRFTAPTFIGDTIHPEMKVVSKRDSSAGGIVVVEETIKNHRGETVCTAVLQVLLNRAPTNDTTDHERPAP